MADAENTEMISEIRRRNMSIRADVVLFGMDDHDRGILCHRELLAASSNFFSRLFASPLEHGRTEFYLGNVARAVLKLTMDFIYGDSVQINGDNVLPTLAAADFLQIPGLVIYCINKLRSIASVPDFWMLFCFAEDNNIPQLRTTVTELMLEKADEFFLDAVFPELSLEMLVELIKSDDLNVQREEDVWDAVRDWFMFNRKEREKCLPHLLDYIRFPLMESKSLALIRATVSRHSISSTRLISLLDEADQITEIGRAFEYSHPRWHQRRRGYENFGIAVMQPNNPANFLVVNPLTRKVTTIPNFPPLEVSQYGGASDEEEWNNNNEMKQVSYEPSQLFNSPDGVLYAVGGAEEHGVEDPEIFKFDPRKGEWAVASEYPAFSYTAEKYHFPTPGSGTLEHFMYQVISMHHFAGGVVEAGRWCLMCQSRFHPYDRLMEEPLPFIASFGTSPVAYGDHIYMFHCTSPTDPNDPLRGRRTFRWIPGGMDDSWHERAPAPVARYMNPGPSIHSSYMKVADCVASEGQIYFVGDAASLLERNTIEVYDAIENKWRVIDRTGSDDTSSNSNQVSQAVTLFNGKLVLFRSDLTDRGTNTWKTTVFLHDDESGWSEGFELDEKRFRGSVGHLAPFRISDRPRKHFTDYSCCPA